MKKQTKIVGIVAIAMVVAIIFSTGVAAAARTSFSIVVNDGTVSMETSLKSTSNEAIPYDAVEYDYKAIAVHAAGVQMTHDFDFEQGYLEVENSILYFPASGLKVVFLRENVQRVKIAEGIDNASLCYDASAGSRATAQMLEYESASIITDKDLMFGVNAAGAGRIAVQTAEYLQQGNINGSWMSSMSSDFVAVRRGNFNLSAQFSSLIPESPPMAQKIENILCPFYKQ